MVYPVLAMTQEVLNFINLQKCDIETQRNIIQTLNNAFNKTARFVNNSTLEERFGFDINKESKKLFQVWSEVLEVIKPLDVKLASLLEKQIAYWICPSQLLLTIKTMKTFQRKKFEYHVMIEKMHLQVIQIKNKY